MDDPDRDRFVLSKGHAALALYGALYATGRLSATQLNTFCADATARRRAPGAPAGRRRLLDGLARPWAIDGNRRGARRTTPALDSPRVSRCSATPSATRGRSGRRRCSPHTTGSRTLWRSSTSTASRRLGYTRDVLDLEPLGERWQQLWLGRPRVVDGHDVEALTDDTRHGSTTTAARRTWSWREPCSERACRSWRAGSNGTTCRCPTTSTRSRRRSSR